MSTYWGYVCLDHDPHLGSEHWFNHGEDILWDAWSRERAGIWPHVPFRDLPPEDCEPAEVEWTSSPIWWLRAHPNCNVALQNEYGDIERLPRRVQLSRARGWRKPANTVSVARPGRFGNPFRVGVVCPDVVEPDLGGPVIGLVRDNMHAVTLFDAWLGGRIPSIPLPDFDWRAELRGKNLACFCPLDQPCHADVLLDLANGASS